MAEPFDAFAWITAPTFSGDYGRETILDSLVRGWGWRLRCVACSAQRDWHTDEMLTRFGRSASFTAREVGSRLTCGACGSPRVVISVFQSAGLLTGHKQEETLAARREAVLAQIRAMA